MRVVEFDKDWEVWERHSVYLEFYELSATILGEVGQGLSQKHFQGYLSQIYMLTSGLRHSDTPMTILAELKLA